MASYDLVLKAAGFIEPSSLRLIRDRAVCIRGGHVAAVCAADDPRATGDLVHDFGQAVILPAFVNAHAHLDLSHLRGQPLDGENFGEWLSAVVRSRSSPRDLILTALQSTLAEMLASGTAGVMDILADTPYAVEVARMTIESGLRAAIAVELLSLDPDREDQVAARTQGLVAEVLDQVLRYCEEDLACYVDRMIEGDRTPCVAISPHAPYTVSPRMYGRMAQYAERHLMPQTTHMSEATAEREFLLTGGGKLGALFSQMGADTSKMRWTDKPAVQTWLDAVSAHTTPGVNETLLVHCYDLTDQEVAALGEAKATVVCCPRSRMFFGHPRFRWAELEAAGVTICLGTDSLGSNQDLDMLRELSVARFDNPEVSVQSLWRAATLNGRAALASTAWRRPQRLAGIADLQVRAWPAGADGGNDTALLEALIDDQPACLATVIGGRVVMIAA